MPHRRPVSSALAATVLERDAYSCRFCRMTNAAHLALYGSQLQIHHIKLTGSLPPEVRRDTPADLITVCIGCHNVLHGVTRQLIDYIRSDHCHLLQSRVKIVRSKPSQKLLCASPTKSASASPTGR